MPYEGYTGLHKRQTTYTSREENEGSLTVYRFAKEPLKQMIKRLYINNFRSLINLQLEPGKLMLLMGPNGAGKSSVFDLLDKLRRLVGDGERLEAVFPSSDLSRVRYSDGPSLLRLELEVAGADTAKTYHYALEIEYTSDAKKQRISHEILKYDGITLFELKRGEAHLYRDDGSKGPVFPMDWTQSGVGFLMPGNDNAKLTWFKERIQRIWVVRLNPFAMKDESRKEVARPDPDMSNYADWYRGLALSSFEAMHKTMAHLQERLPGFKVLRLDQSGDAGVLKAEFTDGQRYNLSALSEGQRALIVLYSLMNGLAEEQGATLCIDEPENFLALPEIQPWVDSLNDVLDESHLQAFLISHHPRLVNYLAAGWGQWFERDGGTGPTRCKKIGPSESEAPVSMDELVARGWVSLDA